MKNKNIKEEEKKNMKTYTLYTRGICHRNQPHERFM